MKPAIWAMMPITIQATPTMMPIFAFRLSIPTRRDMTNPMMLKIKPMVEVHGMIARIRPIRPKVLPGSLAAGGGTAW